MIWMTQHGSSIKYNILYPNFIKIKPFSRDVILKQEMTSGAKNNPMTHICKFIFAAFIAGGIAKVL